MFLGPVFMVLVGLAIYFVIISSSRRSTHAHYRQNYPSQGRALEILNERYAKGEINNEQYLQMRKTLEEN